MSYILPPTKNENFHILIEHIPTSEKVDFVAWVTGFTDNFQSAWQGTPVYGRMDDLYTFQKTSRSISLAFDVVAGSETEAFENQKRLNRLAQFLYPVYSDPVAGSNRRNSQILQAAPLLTLKWNSLIQNAADGNGLTGFLQGFSYAPVIDHGQFFNKASNQKDMVYQTYNVQLEFTVLHTHLTGWVVTSTDVQSGKTTYSFGGKEPQIGQNFPRPQSGGPPGTAPDASPEALGDGTATPPEGVAPIPPVVVESGGTVIEDDDDGDSVNRLNELNKSRDDEMTGDGN